MRRFPPVDPRTWFAVILLFGEVKEADSQIHLVAHQLNLLLFYLPRVSLVIQAAMTLRGVSTSISSSMTLIGVHQMIKVEILGRLGLPLRLLSGLGVWPYTVSSKCFILHLQKPCQLSDTNRGYGSLAGLAINYSSIISPKTRGDAQRTSVTVSVSDGEVRPPQEAK